MTEGQIRTVADQILSATLGPSGYDHVEVRPGYDHAGDPSLFVKAIFKPGVGVTAGGALNRAGAELRSRLLDLGEERPTYLGVGYPDDEILSGNDGYEEP